MKNLTPLLALLFFSVSSLYGQGLYFPDDPALTPDGKTIIFAYAGDLWQMPATGGQANRITALDGAESKPKVSPDGKWLAFSSAQYGNNDIYVTPLGGGAIKQLTFHQASDEVASWSWDSQSIHFTSNRYNGGTTFTVPAAGGTPVALTKHYFNTFHHAVPHPANGKIFFNESSESSRYPNRKRYVGPNSPDIKTFDPATGAVEKLTDWEGKDMWPMVDRNGKSYFVSDRGNEEYNLYQLEGKDAKRLTKFKTSVFSPSISADGSAIVFIRDYQLQVYEVKSGKSRTVPVELNAFAGLAKTKDFSTDGKVSYFDIARDGKKIAFVSRGELFISDIEGKFIRQLETGPDRVLEVKWLKDDKTLLFTQTYNGYQNLHTIPADGSAAPTRRTSDARNSRNLEMAHDTSQVAYLSGRDEVRIMDLSDFSVSTVAKREVWFRGAIPRWSPDDRYLMFTGFIDFEEDIFLADLKEDMRVINLTKTGVSEKDPVWSPDGKYIYFTSARHQPSYPRGGGDVNLYRLPLEAYDQPYRSEKVDELFADEEEKKAKEKKDSVVVSIDFDGIMERMQTVGPRFGTQSGPMVVQEKDKTIVVYGSNHDEGRGKLFMTVFEPFESPKTEAIAAQGVGNATDLITVKGKHYLVGAGKIQLVNLGTKKAKAIELKKTFRRTLESEFKQMFQETWANMEENFYNEDFHGVDWDAKREQYAAFLPYVSSRADLRRITNDMLGELNTSHYGFSSRGEEEETKEGARTLDAGLVFRSKDAYLVDRVITNGPADRKGVDIRPGDRLVAIDGQRIDPKQNREFYFSRPSVDKEVELTFSRNGTEVKQGLHPQSYFSARTQRYDEWMDACQQRVDEKSGKRIAYVHMKNMTGGELNRFMNEMVSEGYNREATILDLRWNTGGNVHDAVLQFLAQQPYLEWKFREGKPGNQPNFAPRGKPIVLLINQKSLSDAEMTAAGFKELGLGTIVGTPTYRWIIFTSGKGLVDGSFYRLPSWGCYTLQGENLEKTGVSPDVRIDNTAADREAGRDPQLDKAIELALKGLE